MSGLQSWALLCRFRCRWLLAEIPKGVDRHSELKQRLHLWESATQCHEVTGRWPCALLCLLPQELDHSPHSTERNRNSSHQCGVCRGMSNRLGWKAVQTSAERHEGARSKQARFCVAALRQIVADVFPWSCWRTAGTPGRRRLLRGSWSEEELVPGSSHSHDQVGQFGPFRWDSSCSNTSRGDSWHSVREKWQH